jgi:calcineurin-like phosphoesterase family protein
VAKVLILGDTHGDAITHVEAIKAAAVNGAQHVFQVGDCGLFPAFYDTTESADIVNEVARGLDVMCHWIRGNHDSTDAWEFFIKTFPDGKGRGLYRSNIRLYPRVKYFKAFGLQWLEVGGAISIDKIYRLSDEKKTGHRTQYWDDEAISGADLRLVDDRKVDVLLTHDCSNKTPFGQRIKDDPDSEQNRMKVDKILNRSRPDFHFHGHMHEKYDWGNYMVHQMNHETRTIGLECNPGVWNPDPNNWVIFDTETKEVEWKL